jgi:hypothetical protein
MFRLFRPKFAPSLIDLVQYEKDLLYYRRKRISLPPPPMIPGLLFGSWSNDELQAMRDNRKEAEKIYNEISRMNI